MATQQSAPEATELRQAPESELSEPPARRDLQLATPQENTLSTEVPLRVRLADRTKWPRKWWWPASKKIELSEEDWKKQHDEISKALNKLLLVLIGFCFFCGLALGAPDRSLLASDAKIKLPFADTEISFVAFLILAPLVLTALSFYLHIFAGYWLNLTRQRPSPSNSELLHPELPFVFNLPYRTATWLSTFLFYWLVPIMLGVFTWKVLPRPEAPTLIAFTSSFVVVFLFLLLRRRSNQTSKIGLFLLWLTFLCSVSFAALAFYSWASNHMLGRHDPQFWQIYFRRVLSRQLHLQKADLTKQDLEYVDLTVANLYGAHLAGADLYRAHLAGADLYRANLTGANLTGAHLSVGASDAIDLTQEQLNSARGNKDTELPHDLVMPKSWK